MKTAYKILLAILMVIGISFNASAQENIWSANNDNPDSLIKDKAVARAAFPSEFKLFNLNYEPFRQQVFSIVDSETHDSTVISLPNADGFIERFEIFEASNFDAELQARFPEIRAYSGRGITDPYATLKLSISPQGIQTMVFRTEQENEYIEAYSKDRTVYAVFRAHREKGGSPWSCSTQETNLISELNSQVLGADRPESNAGQVKTMRLAQSCNGEYSNFFGAFNPSQVALVLAGYNGTLTRANGVYEKDLAIHLNLIANTTAVIYYDPLTDPYTTLGSWNNQLAATLAANIGEANYDIGHMFGASGGGGNAGCIGCVCVDGQKGRGITSPADNIPMGDNFDIDYVVHEVGHQMGANHTFSFSNEGTGRNKEVGSGITIMGYAGITSQDVAPHSIDTFHETSIEQIQANMATKPCPITTVMTVNHPPVVAPVGPFTIPITTAFTLTGSATDPEGDPLTYQWEQSDNTTTTGAASCASVAKATGPNWLSFLPTASPTRTFPRLSTVLSGLFLTPQLPGGDVGCNIEAVSSISRTLNFRLTVRDNNPYVPGVKTGQTQFTNAVVNVTSTAGPFKVTAPNSNVTYAGGSSQTITWDVANTTAAPVSVANVKISISFDGGLTFPVVLADNTANDGTETLTIPNTGTTAGRIKIEAVGNIFFDISDANFTVTGPTPTPTPSSTSTTTPTATSTNTGTPSPSPTNTATQTATATPTASPSPGCNTTVSYTGPAVAIPDNIPAGVNINLPVSGAGLVNDLNFRFDTAGACDATLGNANAAMDHTFIGDLTFKLTPPDGSPTVSFQARRGGTRENICLTTLNDEGGFPNISTLTSVTGQTESGNFTPETTGMLSLFDGENANGTWVLNVSDNAGIDVGSMRRFSLIFNSEGTGCGGTPVPTSTATSTPTSTPTVQPSGTPSCTPGSIYDNGSMVTNPTGGPGGAPLSALQTGLGLNILGFSAAASTTNRIADDFTIPAGGATINTVTLFGYQTGSTTTSTFNVAHVQIWNGPPNAGGTVVFGDTTTNRFASTAFTGIYRATDTAPTGNTRPIMSVVANVGTTLPAGTYWIDFQLGGTGASGPFVPPVSILGMVNKPGSNGLQFTTSWASLIDTGTAMAVQDVPFIINGGGACGTPTATSTGTPATPTATSTGTPAAVSVQFGSATYSEDESQTAAITVTRTGDTTGTTTVNFATSNGTATGGAACTSGVDYISVAQAVTFNAGETSKTVNVQLCSDTLTEPTQTVTLTLTGASVGSPGTAVLSIVDAASAYRSTGSICTTFGGTGAPYPATIAVANGPASIGSVRVTLFDVVSTVPDSMDFLLVGPGGQKFILMADAGGVVDLVNPVTLTFSDAAGQVVPNGGPLTTGVFEPTSWEPGQTSFPAPAPPAPYNEPGSTVGGTGTQTLVGNFGTTNSNGTWSLYMRDDAGAFTNAVTACVNGGWGLEFLGATAANASVSGRVTTSDGRGIRNATVVVTGDSLAAPIAATTGSFGYFTFDGLATGETYIVTVNSQRYAFAAPSRVLSLIDNVVDADFVADPQE